MDTKDNQSQPTDEQVKDFQARMALAKAEIIEVCKRHEVDIVPVLEQIGEPRPDAIAVAAKLSFIDTKYQPSLVVPGSENVAN